ncbi:hypothetical protein [Stenotrophomonas rhizophila]
MLFLLAKACFERVHSELLWRTAAHAALRYQYWVFLIISRLQKVRFYWQHIVNPKRRHGMTSKALLVEFERLYFQRLEGV